MSENSEKVKQKIVEKIKSSTNILVTVSKNPAVDDLAAALGLTALLNKIDKHATAIFSGTIPPAITFLEPDKVFESTADSLRDFIIALDKDKADHLRYKVEDDLVKIFITPYRANLTQEDVEFSQGDYNVELVLALGVAQQEDLDTALSAHQMLDDVTIMTLSAGSQSSQLGSDDWRDETASSLSEMVSNLAGGLVENGGSLLDKQISTALLTGIVAATNRFSNENTSSRVMSLSAELMAAGADQQLIAAKLQETHAINSVPTYSPKGNPETKIKPGEQDPKKGDDGKLTVSHEEDKEVSIKVPTIDEILSQKTDESQVADSIIEPEVSSTIDVHSPAVAMVEGAEEPTLGGTLNATSEQAAQDAKRDLENSKNKTILSHSYLANDSTNTPQMSGATVKDAGAPLIDIFNGPSTPSSSEPTLPLPPPLPDEFSTLPPAVGDINNTIAPPPLSEEPVDSPIAQPEASTLPPQLVSSDPGQFKIPN